MSRAKKPFIQFPKDCLDDKETEIFQEWYKAALENRKVRLISDSDNYYIYTDRCFEEHRKAIEEGILKALKNNGFDFD